ncbi:hypothetical protein Hanom_Chr03g00231981 [Helianthus anomalus]
MSWVLAMYKCLCVCVFTLSGCEREGGEREIGVRDGVESEGIYAKILFWRVY